MSGDSERATSVRRPPNRLRLLLLAGVLDSTGLAFGWTVILLVATEQGGLDLAAALSSAMLIGVALSAPFSAVLARCLSPRAVLRTLAVSEAGCRLSLFILVIAHAPASVIAPLIVVMNVFAWSGFAAMRSEAARTERTQGGGASLTAYVVAIAASEALATAAASMIVGGAPAGVLLYLTMATYVGALIPQWLAAEGAPRTRAAPGSRPRSHGVRLRPLVLPCGLGSLVFVLAGAPAVLATAIAFERYGTVGVAVSAVAFAVGSLASVRIQAMAGRASTPAAAFGLGALMIGGWSLSGTGLIGLALAQVMAGAAQCALEGDLDTRATAGSRPADAMTGLSLASSGRALGGAASVAALPFLLPHVSLPVLSGVTAAGLAIMSLLFVVHPASSVPTPRVGVPRPRRSPEDLDPVRQLALLAVGDHRGFRR
jgi:hypothetical protein